MSKPDDKQWLSAAECAARTGLTVRALRVYEREGLVSPARSIKGWRRYGPDELARLNVVTSLKALGLTLEQIRQVMTASAPPLTQILEIQIESWRAKRALADRALRFLDAAARRVASGPLSLDEICELVQGLEVSRSFDMQDGTALFRRLLNESLSAEEERAWHTWWAEHPSDLADARSSGELLRSVFTEFDHLVERRAAAASSDVQAAVRRYQEILTQFDARGRALRLMQWNPSITARFYRIWPKAFTRKIGLSDPTGPAMVRQRRLALLGAALQSSPVGHASGELARNVKKLLDSGIDPGSPEADAATARLSELCAVNGLGDPYVYVQWHRFTSQLTPSILYDRIDDAAWAFLARALESRGHGDRSSVSELEGWLEEMRAMDVPAPVLEHVPVVPMRDLVVYPGMVIPLFAGRPRTMRAAETAMRGNKRVIVVTQRRPDVAEPAREDLYPIGTVATVVELAEIANGTLRILVKCVGRVRLDQLHTTDHLAADATVLADIHAQAEQDTDLERNALITRFERFAKFNGWPTSGTPVEPTRLAVILASFNRLDDGRLADTIAAYMPLPLARKQEVLELLDVPKRLEHVDAVTRDIKINDPGG